MAISAAFAPFLKTNLKTKTTRGGWAQFGRNRLRTVIVFGMYDDLLNSMEDRSTPPNGKVRVLVNGEPPTFPAGRKPSPKDVKKTKLAKQRAGGETATGIVVTGTPRDKQAVRVEMAQRGQKQVTMIRGLEVDIEARKELLKYLKGKLGGGGTIDPASGTVEVQGAHGEKVVAFLLNEGFSGAKQAGKAK